MFHLRALIWKPAFIVTIWTFNRENWRIIDFQSLCVFIAMIIFHCNVEFFIRKRFLFLKFLLIFCFDFSLWFSRKILKILCLISEVLVFTTEGFVYHFCRIHPLVFLWSLQSSKSFVTWEDFRILGLFAFLKSIWLTSVFIQDFEADFSLFILC